MTFKASTRPPAAWARRVRDELQGLLTRMGCNPARATQDEVHVARITYRFAIETTLERCLGDTSTFKCGDPSASDPSWHAGALAVKRFTLEGVPYKEKRVTREGIALKMADEPPGTAVRYETLRRFEGKVLKKAAELVAREGEVPDLRTSDVEDLLRTVELLHNCCSGAASQLESLRSAEKAASRSIRRCLATRCSRWRQFATATPCTVSCCTARSCPSGNS